MIILAVRNGMAVLDGDASVCIGDVLIVRGAPGFEWARLRVVVEGPFPVARISRLQTGVSAEALVGMEAEPEGEPCPDGASAAASGEGLG